MQTERYAHEQHTTQSVDAAQPLAGTVTVGASFTATTVMLTVAVRFANAWEVADQERQDILDVWLQVALL